MKPVIAGIVCRLGAIVFVINPDRSAGAGWFRESRSA